MDMKLVDFVGKILTENGQLTREDHVVCRALINCMSENETEDLLDDYELDWHLSSFIEKKNQMEFQPKLFPIEHNKDWQIYFKILKLRSIGKVEIARKHLHDIFPYLQWNSQRQLLRYSLLSTYKVDRIWALEQLFDDWSLIADSSKEEFTCWTNDIEAVWNKYQDKESAYLLLKYMPYEWAEKYEQELSDVVGYKQVALRLGTNVDYDIERYKISDIDYLYVMAKLMRPISKKMAEMILSETLLQVINESFCPINCTSAKVSLLSDKNISLVIWCLGRLNHPDIIMDFYENNKQLQLSMKGMLPKSDSFNDLQSYWVLLCSKAKYQFPLIRGYNKQIIKQLIKRNPSLAELIRKLQLELVE